MHVGKVAKYVKALMERTQELEKEKIVPNFKTPTLMKY